VYVRERDTNKTQELSQGEEKMAFKDAKTAIEYIMAGKSVFTLVSGATGNRFTYRVNKMKKRCDADRETYYISVLSGPDNTNDYSRIAMMFDDRLVFPRSWEISPNAPSAAALSWSLTKLQKGIMPSNLSVHHNGHCGRCGRHLTTPESVETGLGPICAGKV